MCVLREEILRIVVRPEQETFWTTFLRALKARGLSGVKLVITDAHTGLKKAISTVSQGAAWWRCRFISSPTCWA